MKKQTRTLACRLRVSWWWAGIALAPFLAGACKPHDLVCENGSYFQLLQPEEGAGVAPFSIERLGPEVKRSELASVPYALTLKSDNRVRVDWKSIGHILGHNDLIFSPAEGLARNVNRPNDVYPMRRVSDGASERVRFGFRSAACRVPGKGIAFCQLGDDDLFLAAEATCHPE